MLINVLWPFVPVGVAFYYRHIGSTLARFIIHYLAMLPAAHLLGFASQELCRKLPKVPGLSLEVTLGSVVEMILFMVLISRKTSERDPYPTVIRAAILGSILANLLLCLGLCCFVGGFGRREQNFHEVVSEAGSSLLLVAGFVLLIPSAFYSALHSFTLVVPSHEKFKSDSHSQPGLTLSKLGSDTLAISRGTAVILLLAFILYVCRQDS